MASVKTNNNQTYIVFGIVQSYYGITRTNGHDLTVKAGRTITLDCGMKLLLENDFHWCNPEKSLFEEAIIIAEVNPTGTTLPDSLKQHKCKSVKALYTGDKKHAKRWRECFNAAYKYNEYYNNLTKDERDALIYGIAAGAGTVLTLWKGAGLFIDWITPGGPLLPVGSICTTAISGALTCVSANAHMEAVQKARKNARSLEQSLKDMQKLAKRHGYTDDAVVCNPAVQSYCTNIAKLYEDTRQELSKLANLVATPQNLPCYNAST